MEMLGPFGRGAFGYGPKMWYHLPRKVLPMKNINTYFDVSTTPKNKLVLTVSRGKFKDIKIRMNKVAFGEDLPDGGCMLDIDYTVLKNPNGYDVSKSVEKSVGEFIIYVLEQQLKREKINDRKARKTV